MLAAKAITRFLPTRRGIQFSQRFPVCVTRAFAIILLFFKQPLTTPSQLPHDRWLPHGHTPVSMPVWLGPKSHPN